MIGHDRARRALETALPQATLLYGPPSIGKWTLAVHLADHHHVHVLDRWLVDHGLSISTARLITHFAGRAPQGHFKLVIARLDDASRPALNALLKTIEEPPPRVRFLFTAATKPQATVASRCHVYELGELSIPELEAIYEQAGVPRLKRRRAAEYARGNVKRGFDAERADAHRAQVIALIKAVAVGDHDQFAACFTTWDARHSELLNTLLTEALTRQWHTFTEADTAGLHEHRRTLWRMTVAVVRVKDVRPKLGIRAVLEPFLRR